MFMKLHVFRVKPKEELISRILSYCDENNLTSGIVVGIIGSVEGAQLNFLKGLPGKYESVNYVGPLEIVSAQGSIALKGKETIIHIHIQLSGEDMCGGGHLVNATILSTAEVVIGEIDDQLYRQLDEYTGLNELVN